MAPLALLFWPAIAVIIFAQLKAARGLIWSVTVGYLFLPEAIALDLPGLPPYDKSAAIAIGAMLGALLFRDPKVPQQRQPRPGLTLTIFILSTVLLLSPIGTLLANPDALINGTVERPALSFGDLRGMVFSIAVTFVPFILAYQLIHHRDHYQEALAAVVTMALFYTLLALVEIRMSPQIHTWVYGYFQHEWFQHERGGSYRPLVFLRHGLWLGFFLVTAMCAALALSRNRNSKQKRYLLSALWIFVVLVLSRNLGATILALIVAPMIVFLGAKTQIRIAATMALFFLFYPIIMSSGLSPANRILAWTEHISSERAASFAFRLSNENRLIERALERPAFGWGVWGRSRVFNERGVDLSVADGIWIVVLGERGWLGYLAQFGLLVLPLVLLALRNNTGPPPPEIAGMTLIMGANFLYMIPNSTLSPIGLLIAGTLAASLRIAKNTQQDEALPDKLGARPPVRYSRFSDSTVKIAGAAQNSMPPDDPKRRGPEPYKRV